MSDIPVLGYREQTSGNVMAVNQNKQDEERLLRKLDSMLQVGFGDARWIAIARTHFEQGFMALNRAIFRPKRVNLDEEDA